MRQFVSQQVRACQVCQTFKTPRRSLGDTNLLNQDPSIRPFDTVAVDSYGPLPTFVSRNNYIVVLQCLFSRYSILIPVPDIQTPTVVSALCSRLFSEHGLPRILLSDNGSPYSPTLMQVVMMTLKVNQKYSPAYHPQSNGQVERFMSTLRQMIASYIQESDNHVHWDEHLGLFQLAYNSSTHAETGSLLSFSFMAMNPMT